MLECSTCLRRCIRTVFADILPIHPPLRTSNRFLPKHPGQTTCLPRGYNTDAIPFEKPPPRGPPGLPPLPTRYVPRSNRPEPQEEPFSKSSLELEVRWLKDPMKLAKHTVELLKGDQQQKALAIVRLASRDVPCTVSWNHLVDYEMGKGRVANGVKLYNEMKKRAQTPDAYTFTTLFRGLSLNAQYPLTVSRALSIYHSMFTDTSPVKPNTIHTNAVLKVCALAGDIDGLLGVAARLPTRGRGAPDNLTFTTILNGIRSVAWEDTKDQGESSARNERRSRAIMQGRRLWEEIRDRWAKGDLYVDEELVCAMGRLLLISSEGQDCDDVLSLLEQTMGLARQIPRLGDPAHRGSLRELEAITSAEEAISEKVELQTLLPPAATSTRNEADLSDPTASAFAPLPKGPPTSQPPIRPGRNTLSLVIDACIRLRLIRAAQSYWGMLTSETGTYKILPDAENYHMYLRLLRVQHASKLAVELVEEMRRGDLGKGVGLKTKTFRIAMSCVKRDKNNRHALQYAGRLIRIMTDTLECPDSQALSMYLDLAVSEKPRDWRTIMGAIRGTELGLRNLRSLLAYDPVGSREQSEEDVLGLVRRMVGAFDVVLDLANEDMSREEKARCREQRHTLASYITRNASRMEYNEREAAKQYESSQMRGDAEEEVGSRERKYDDDPEDVELDLAARREMEEWPQGRGWRTRGRQPSQSSDWKRRLRHEKRGERRERVKKARARRQDTGLRSEREEGC